MFFIICVCVSHAIYQLTTLYTNAPFYVSVRVDFILNRRACIFHHLTRRNDLTFAEWGACWLVNIDHLANLESLLSNLQLRRYATFQFILYSAKNQLEFAIRIVNKKLFAGLLRGFGRVCVLFLLLFKCVVSSISKWPCSWSGEDNPDRSLSVLMSSVYLSPDRLLMS